MVKLRSFFIACMALAMTVAVHGKDYKYQSVDGDMMKSRIYKLDNGLTVYLTVNNEKPRIQTYIAVRTGSRNDPAETTGLAHYLEHLMFKGTKAFGTTDYAAEKPLLDAIEAKYEHYRTLTDPEQRKSCYREIDSLSQLAARFFIPNEYDKLMSSIGAQGTNAYTSNDVTCYTEDIPANEVENWLRIQADRFENMVIRGFHTELEAVYEEKNISLTDDFGKAYDALNAKLYPGHPYGTQTTIGTQEHLKNPSITNIKNYFKRYYVPNNVAICMSGDFNPDTVIAQIDRYFGSWKADPALSRPEYPALAELTSAVDTTVVGQEAESLMLGWRFKGAADMQADTLGVISLMLANGEAGLMETDLEQQMLVQRVAVMIDGHTDYTSMLMFCQPKDGQTLEELRAVVLKEMGKLRSGDFDDRLLPAVINNMKLEYYKQLRDNGARANMFVQTFIQGRPWATEVGAIDRISKITKQQIVDFARRHLGENYVCVYKKMGNDTTIKKIDKPQITAIPANRNLQSDFLKEVVESEAKPIQPRFLDFDADLTVTKTGAGVPLLYKQNTDDGLFDLCYRYEFGTEDVKGMDIAPDYLYYIGTDKKSSEQVKKDFYSLACNYSIGVGADYVEVRLSGLSENMPKAVAMLDDLLNNAKGDDESFGGFVDMLEKSRGDLKTNQDANFSYLFAYGRYGRYNSQRNTLSEQELRAGGPQLLTGMLKKLAGYEHTVMYYGPETQDRLVEVLKAGRHLAAKLSPAPVGKAYEMALTQANEVMIAPYDAKNIYMVQFHNEGRRWHAEEAPVQALFNEYFGGGMNTVVFQELRESRGLAYSAFARYNAPARKNQTESFYTYIISQNDKMMDCVNVFNNILDDMPQSQSAFDIAKQSLIKKLQSERTTRFNVLRAYVEARNLGIDYDIKERIYNALPAIKMADVISFEQQNMAKKPFRYIILGDEKELDMESLGKIGPVKRLSTEEIFGF